MKHKQLLFSAVATLAVSAIPAMALLKPDRNALSHGPVMKSEFQQPHSAENTDEANDMNKSEEATPKLQKATVRKSAPAGTELPTIVASVYNFATNEIGMYRLPEVSGGEMQKLSDVSSYYGGSMHNNIYYACDDGRYNDYWDTDNDPHGHRIQAYDINTWEKIGDPVNLTTYRAGDLAIDPATGLGYAFCDYGSMMYHLYSINLQTGEQTDLTPNSTFFSDESRAIAFDSEGTLWGVTRNGDFGSINLSTGKISVMTNLGESSNLQYGFAGAIDPDTGNFLFMYNGSPDYNTTQESRLYSVNTQTGEATLLADFSGLCITSMFVLPDQVSPSAPGAPTDLSANFPDGELAGTVNFTMPSTLYDGSAASGDATWNVFDGKDKVAEGTAAYGVEVSADVTVAQGGKHTLTVTVSNTEGEGKKGRLVTWIGPDTPQSPSNIVVDFNEQSHLFSISWDPVTEGKNGGYVNHDAITYDVSRLPADEAVASGITETSCTFTYEPEGIEAVTFAVTAHHGDLTSDPGISDPTVTGALALPYDLANVESNKKLEHWTVIDSNNDGKTWAADYYNGIYYNYSSSDAADDWAMTPPIKALKGCRYKINVAFKCQSAPIPRKLKSKRGMPLRCRL